MNLDDTLRTGGQALRAHAADSLDLDDALDATLSRPLDTDLEDGRSHRRRSGPLVAASIAGLTVSALGIWYATSDSDSDRLVPADSVEPQDTVATPTTNESTAPRGVADLDEGFSAAAVFSVLPASVTVGDGSFDGSIDRTFVQAADLRAFDAATGNPRPSTDDGADEWLSEAYGLDEGIADADGLVLSAPGFPPLASTVTSEQRRDELGFDLIDADVYASISAVPNGHFEVFTGDQIALSDEFVELPDGVLSLGTGEDYIRSVDEISPVRSLGQPVRATVQAGVVAVGSSTADVADWPSGASRLIDDDRFLAAAQALDTRELIDVGAVIMDFSAAPDAAGADGATMITEPFSVLAVGTSVDNAGVVTVITYVFDGAPAATDMRDVIDTLWHEPSTTTGDAAADFYTSIGVAASGRTVTVTAPLGPGTLSTKWLEFLVRGESIFFHSPSPTVDSAGPSATDNPCATPEACALYSIQPGDFPLLIAERFCTTVSALESANGWSDLSSDFPSPDSWIRVPRAATEPSCADPVDELPVIEALDPPIVAPTATAFVDKFDNGGDEQIWIAAGSSEGHVVAQKGAEYLEIVGLAGTRRVELSETVVPLIVVGDVLYGLGETAIVDGQPSARFVAVALAGPSEGTVVAERLQDWNTYLELPLGSFTLGRDGVVDQSRSVGTTVIEYVDTNGDATVAPIDGRLPLVDVDTSALFDGGAALVTVDGVVSFSIQTSEATREVGLTGPLPPWSGNWGEYVPVIARDGSTLLATLNLAESSWIRIPADWQIAAQGPDGPIVVRDTGAGYEIATVDPIIDVRPLVDGQSQTVGSIEPAATTDDELNPSSMACEDPDQDVATEPGYRQYAAYREWFRDGCLVRIDVIAERFEPGLDPEPGREPDSDTGAMCEFNSERIFVTGDPLGSRYGHTSGQESITYLGDDRNLLTDGATAADVLPVDAEATGYVAADGRQLWMVPGDDSSIFLVADDRIEQWQRGVEEVCG